LRHEQPPALEGVACLWDESERRSDLPERPVTRAELAEIMGVSVPTMDRMVRGDAFGDLGMRAVPALHRARVGASDAERRGVSLPGSTLIVLGLDTAIVAEPLATGTVCRGSSSCMGTPDKRLRRAKIRDAFKQQATVRSLRAMREDEPA
jgi:hypothetical protein